ncbi:MAG: ester cyclase [Rhizobiaceae bacterium]|nr:ester cyclase [Rhizobiaceae bacterium]
MVAAVIRAKICDGLAALVRGRDGSATVAASDILAHDVVWNGCHPIGRLDGAGTVVEKVFGALRESFPDLERRDDVFIAGSFGGSQWLSATGHCFGSFEQDWLGIPATGRWTSLRYGEMYRLEGDRIAEAFVLYDLIDFMRQAGVPPWRAGLGVEGFTPGPRTRDGVRLKASAQGDTGTTFDLVMSMLHALFAPDRQTMGMERFWSPRMMWYGPAMIGATRGLDGFFRDHQTPWMTAFPNWSDALDAPHFADGPYACYAGWPSIRARHDGPLYGLDPTGRTVDIRVMDWWRREDGLLAENWVLLDFPDLFMQLGVDLFALMRERAANRRAER